jgi:hypothetical protein
MFILIILYDFSSLPERFCYIIVYKREIKSTVSSHSSSRTTALGSTQPLAEMSTRDLPGGKRRQTRKVDNLTAICELIV